MAELRRKPLDLVSTTINHVPAHEAQRIYTNGSGKALPSVSDGSPIACTTSCSLH